MTTEDSKHMKTNAITNLFSNAVIQAANTGRVIDRGHFLIILKRDEMTQE